MKFAKSLAFAAASLAFAAAANAQMPSGAYAEVGYTAATYTSSGTSKTVNPSAIRLIVGGNINTNLGLEGMAAFGAGSSNVNVSGVDIAVKIDNMYGLYLKPKYQLNDDVELFGRVGFAHVGASASAMGVSATDSVDGASYGVGGSFKLKDKYSLNVDYMSYGSKDGGNYNGLTVGLGYKY